MRRILARPFFALAAAVLATAVFLPDAPLAHAQPAQNYVTPQAATANTYVTPQAATGAAGDGSSLYSSSQLGSGLTAGAQAQSASGQQSGSALGAPKDPTFGGDAGSQFGSVMTWIMTLFAWLVGVAALSLDYVAYYTVVSMGSYVGNITAIGVAWRVLRDIANIMLIFGFLAIGITTILQVSWYGGAQKLLPKLVIAAVAMNFSLFVCEALIDGTNIIATQFYQQINGGQPLTQTTLANTKVNFVSGSNTDIGNEPISNAIMGQLGFQTLYNAGNVNQKAYEGSNTWLFGFLAIILFGVTAFVLFSLTLILVARFVALIFFILLSPVGFMGWAVPLMQYRADQWWKNFLDQIITAPVLFLLLYVALAVITDAKFLTGDCGGGTCTKTWGFVGGNNLVGFASMLLSFMIAIGLLLVVTIKARSMGAVGADWATKTAGKITFGAAAWAANRTVGRGAYLASRRLRQSEGFNRFNALTGGLTTRALDRAASASFDVRASAAWKAFPGGHIQAGTPTKGGFVEARKQGIKQHDEEVKRIEAAFKEGFNDKDKAKATAEERAAHEEAVNAKTMATSAKASAQEKHDAAKALKKRHEEEVARLEGMEEGSVSPDRIAAAYQNLATSEESLKTASTNLKQATDNLTEAAKVESEAKKAKENAEAGAMSKLTKASKLAYAEGISHSVWNVMPISPNLYSYGPGAGAAAAKIKASVKEKSKEKQALEILEKALKDQKSAPAVVANPTEENK